MTCEGMMGRGKNQPEERRGQSRGGHSLSDEGFRLWEAPWKPLSSAVRGCVPRLSAASFNIQIFILIRDNFYCGKICAVLSHVWIFGTLWTIARQTPLSMGFSRQEYWSGLPCPPPGDLPHPGIKPESPALAGRFFITEPPSKPLSLVLRIKLLYQVLLLLTHLNPSTSSTCVAKTFS